MSLYLCVDCGGTKTAVVICDKDGVIAGRGTGGPSNITYLTVEAFISSVKEAIFAALRSCLPSDATSLPPVGNSPFIAAWLGVSGADSPAAIAKITPAVSSLLGIPVGPDLIIANDTHLLAAPIRMYPGLDRAVAVVGGTGSIAVSFREQGGRIEELARVGGWGWILGDEGGGYDVGREALRQLLGEEDRASIIGQPSPPSKIRNRILERFGVQDVMEILTRVYHPDPPSSTDAATSAWTPDDLRNLPREKRISSLPPLVFAAAFEEDDWLAKRILDRCAGQLASQIALLLGEGKQADIRSVKAVNAVISFGGSLVQVEKYRTMILDQLAQRGYTFRHVHYVDDAAAVGAAGLVTSYKQKVDGSES